MNRPGPERYEDGNCRSLPTSSAVGPKQYVPCVIGSGDHIAERYSPALRISIESVCPDRRSPTREACEASRYRRDRGRRDNGDAEPLPAGARVPPSPPTPPAPLTTGWMDRPGGSPSRPPVWTAPRVTFAEWLRQCLSEFRKIVWPPNGRAVRTNSAIMLLIVILLVVGLGTLELAVGRIAGGLFS
jgi:preprotein translocase subunit SecE